MLQHFSNLTYVYDNWSKNLYFSKIEAKVSFLSWALRLNYYIDDYEIDKLFLDAIDESLLTQEVIDGLSNDSKAKLERIQKVVKAG